MEIRKVNEIRIEETPHKVDVRKLYDDSSAQAMHITLQPGEALKPHITPVDVFFYVLEGTPEIQVGNEKLEIQADSLVVSPKGIVHCLYNNTLNIARILVVKAPKPNTPTRLL
ncbi:MAG: cupin domain-containing protein [Prolixibacteraceae bacterium]|nr:cupin domain-containing protein [Prolixibacteraceae bacterium]